MYALAARIVDQVSDTSWTQCVQIVLQGLGLQRTFTNHPADDNNFARRYVIFGHGDLEEVVSPSLEGGDALEGSGSMRTCVADMLKWCKILFLAPKITDSTWEDGSQPLYPFTPAKPDTLTKERLLRAARTIQQPGFPLTALDTKQNYALGLYNFTLPTERINTVTNAPNITSTYVMGAKSPSRKVIGHTGDMGNFASAYWVFPETESAIVVLTNSSRANGDPSNIVAQVLTQALFGLKPSINYIKLATDVVTQAKSQWQRTVTSWEVHRWAGTMPKDLDAYVGVYSSSDLRMTLDIKPISQVLSSGEPAKLRLWINGLTEQTFELYHYHHDSWTFLPGSRDKCLALGLEIYIPSWRSFILDFDNYVAGRLNTLRWTLDPDQRVKAQIFTRQGKS
ncbi:hypothetical protein MMC28_009801 [Mycoblastus sanguinarius]|nr:hypothetical protein [Mycoblastus sanguinarius]